MDFLTNLDTDIFLFFNSMHCEYMDRVMKLSSDRFVWVPMYAALLAALIRTYGWRRACLILLVTIAAITAADQLCATVIRPEVQRLRPANPANPLSALVHVVDGYRGGSYGFPSCHAANTFALVGLMLPLIRNVRFSVVLVFWALLNCYSRIHLGVHYPGDLLVGGIIGMTIGFICYLIVRPAVCSGKTEQNFGRFKNSDLVGIVFVLTALGILLAAI